MQNWIKFRLGTTIDLTAWEWAGESYAHQKYFHSKFDQPYLMSGESIHSLAMGLLQVSSSYRGLVHSLLHETQPSNWAIPS